MKQSKNTIRSLLLSALLGALAGCVSKPMLVEGLWFEELTVKGTAHIGSVATPVDTTMYRVFVIHEDTLVEMLKQ